MQPAQQVTPPQPALQQAPIPAPPSAPLNPIAQFECWGNLDGGVTVFGFKQYTAAVYPGWLVLYKKDNAEAARIPLAGDLKIKYSFSFARVAQSNGQKFSLFDRQHAFLVGPIWPYIMLLASGLVDLAIRLAFFGPLPYPDEPAFWWRLAGLTGSIVALVILAVVGIPQAKAFKAACYRAAGIAS